MASRQGHLFLDTAIQQQATEGLEQEQTTVGLQSLAPVPSAATPQEFYAEITKREDIRAILERLATV
jgi:hypothetical protein